MRLQWRGQAGVHGAAMCGAGPRRVPQPMQNHRLRRVAPARDVLAGGLAVDGASGSGAAFEHQIGLHGQGAAQAGGLQGDGRHRLG